MTRVLFNADVRAMDPEDTRASAVAWRDGRIVAVGSREQVALAAGPGAVTFDAGGATVLPGFIDPHHHPSIAALYGALVRLRPPAVTDIPSLQKALAAAAERLEPGRWLVALDWDETLLAERRAPTRQELDDAVPDRPLMALHYSCHRAVANSRALELAGIGQGTPDPAGGIISRAKGGMPDGLLIERAMSKVESLARANLIAVDTEGYFARLADHHRALVAAGITRVVDATVPGDLVVLYREAARRGLILVPTHIMPVSTTGYLEMPWEALDGPVTGTEEGPLTFGAVKMVFDGAPACSMCLTVWQSVAALARTWRIAIGMGSLDSVRAAMSLRPRLEGGKLRSGVAIYQRGEADPLVRKAAERGFAVAIHAIGNEAVDVALGALVAAGPALARGGTPRIEHASFLDRPLVTRIADSGAIVVTQPHLVTLPAIAAAASVPGLRYLPTRWLLDAGVVVAGSSDYPVAAFDPLDGIRGAVLRRTARGKAHEPDQCIDLHEALVLYTRAAAQAAGCADRTGTLEPGKRADLVVLSEPLAAERLDAVRVKTTVLGGEVVFDRERELGTRN